MFRLTTPDRSSAAIRESYIPLIVEQPPQVANVDTTAVNETAVNGDIDRTTSVEAPQGTPPNR